MHVSPFFRIGWTWILTGGQSGVAGDADPRLLLVHVNKFAL